MYKKKLGPGSYSFKDGFQEGPHAAKARQKAMRDLKKCGRPRATGSPPAKGVSNDVHL